MFPYDYALEKFGVAVRHLAIGPGDVRSRLWPAYLKFHVLQVHHIPEDLRADFEWVNNELTKREPQDKVWSDSERTMSQRDVFPQISAGCATAPAQRSQNGSTELISGSKFAMRSGLILDGVPVAGEMD